MRTASKAQIGLPALVFGIDKPLGSIHIPSMAEVTDLAARIAAESASLPLEKQSAVLDFVLFVKERAGLSSVENGDAAWERIIGQPTAYPKLDAFLREAAREGEEPLDAARL